MSLCYYVFNISNVPAALSKRRIMRGSKTYRDDVDHISTRVQQVLKRVILLPSLRLPLLRDPVEDGIQPRPGDRLSQRPYRRHPREDDLSGAGAALDLLEEGQRLPEQRQVVRYLICAECPHSHLVDDPVHVVEWIEDARGGLGPAASAAAPDDVVQHD